MINRTQYAVGVKPSADADFFTELKNHVNAQDFAGDDATLKDLIDGVFYLLDGPRGKCNRTLLTSTYEYVCDRFPFKNIEVSFPPIQSISSVTYRDTEGAEQTLVAGTDYRVNALGAENRRAVIVPLNGWPSVDVGGDAIKVTFTAGYQDLPSQLPPNIKQLVKIIVAHQYRDREGDVPAGDAFEGLLGSVKFYEQRR